MFEKLCLICIHNDASLDLVKQHLQRLYSPDVQVVYIRISEDLDVISRALMLKAIRKVFRGADLDILTVSESQIHLVAAMVEYAEKRMN